MVRTVNSFLRWMPEMIVKERERSAKSPFSPNTVILFLSFYFFLSAFFSDISSTAPPHLAIHMSNISFPLLLSFSPSLAARSLQAPSCHSLLGSFSTVCFIALHFFALCFCWNLLAHSCSSEQAELCKSTCNVVIWGSISITGCCWVSDKCLIKLRLFNFIHYNWLKGNWFKGNESMRIRCYNLGSIL